ncbi:TetR/AcrR family transcriptional regulator [Pseudoalteromonas sp. Cn5-37]|uniref:TetR/AcrR family transcriptional regulator n=1 Tax=Pseudoalteromonas sp. Cn5-37 TaxID=2908886 RepID=UPI001F37E214|nr:TetR/AcrR family transcriptional regulator [Pseudoalteromonas sp. Cn5-37]MCF2916347.1 TetR/AcrR family transcriptional regulator [Pseudoalteromonas sp. Cn5-37]
MTQKTKRHSDPALAEARRNQVLCAAADCFRRKGYHGAGMAEISKTAGMSAGHIYNYFASKEAIIESIVERDMEEMFSIFKEFADKPGDRVTVLLDGLDRGVERHTDLNQGALDLEMLAEAARNEKVANLLRESDIHARDSMRELLVGERGPLQGTALEEVNARIEVMFSVMGGLLLRKMLNPDLDINELLKALRPTMKTLLLPFE